MLNRFDGNVVPFASEATSTNRTVFGAETQSDDIDDNLNADFKKGWEIVGLNDNPTREDFNAMGYTLGNLISYLYQNGVAEWNDKQEYKINSIAIGTDGNIYQSLVDSNIGNALTDTTKWVCIASKNSIVNSIAELKTISNIESINVLGYYEKGDGGGGLFYWDNSSTEADNGGTIIQATGVTTGRWKRVFSGAVNVKWFGAKGDGVTDDSVAIQKAYNYLAVDIKGGTIYIPATKEGYKINTAINCTNSFYGINFVGEGSAALPNARPNNDTLGTTIWLNTGTVGFDLTGCATIGISSLTLDTFNTTKVTNPARVGILSGRTAEQSNSFNHRFTDISVFMKTTGSATSPSIALFASNVELMTAINCWFHADCSTVLTNEGLYNVSSPFVSIVNTSVSATCNTLLSCKFISISGVAPSLRINQTVNNTILSSYFGNDIDTTTYPSVLCTGAVQKLSIKGFQSEDRTVFLQATDNLIECDFYGTHASASTTTAICNFDTAGNVHGCKFDIYNSGTSVIYNAYTGVVDSLANTYFNLGYTGKFNVTSSIFKGNSFDKLGAYPSFSGIPSVDSDATVNGEYMPSLFIQKREYAVAKTNTNNNSAYVFALVNVPSIEINGYIEIPYTLNSVNAQATVTGKLRVNVSRYGGFNTAISLSEVESQVTVRPLGTETISASFAIGSISGGSSSTQSIQLTCTINSSIGGASFIRGIATVQSSYFVTALVNEHIYITNV